MKKLLSIILSISIILSTLCISTVAYAKTYSNTSGTLKITTSDMYRPTVLNKGQSYTLSGRLKANKKLKYITITIEDLDQFKKDISYSKAISGKTLNLKRHTKSIKFQSIPSGEKLLTITITAKDGSKINFKRKFTILGKANEPVHITNLCKIKVDSGSVSNVTDSNDDTLWNSGTMTINLPKDKVADGLYIKWFVGTNNYTLKSYDNNDKVLDTYNGSDLYFLHQYYPLNKNAKKVIIKLKKNPINGKGIACLRVYEKGKVGVSVEKWKRPENGKCDLMVISCHRDDELLYFGGTIPYYQSVKKKNVYTVYMSGNDRPRVREALAGQWSMGTRNYPVFMGFPGGYHDGINGTIKDWGGEDYCLQKLVEKIRKYQPKVIVTHDENGEYGHPSHKTTSLLVTKAVQLAGDSTKYKESYDKYGICKVQKVYKHYTNKNRITMNWDKKYSALDGKSPFQMACVGYDKHRSQHGSWSMTCDAVKKCPSNQFGLVYTKVGKDKNKNDFFENVK